jgi:hypothetical protein
MMNEALKDLHTLNLIRLIRSWDHSEVQGFVDPKIFSEKRIAYLSGESKMTDESRWAAIGLLSEYGGKGAGGAQVFLTRYSEENTSAVHKEWWKPSEHLYSKYQ